MWIPKMEAVMLKPTDSSDGSTFRPAATSALDGDLDLVQACRDGDAAAFEQLVKRYDVRLFGIAQSITQNREDAGDAVQEAFLNAFRNITRFSENSRFSTWLIRITINTALTKRRKRRSIREVSIDEDLQDEKDIFPRDFADWAPNHEELYRGDELRDILRDALGKLRPGLRMVFVLRDIEGISTNEAAELLALTPAAIKTRLMTARLLLREQLSKYFAAGKRERRKTHSHSSRKSQATASNAVHDEQDGPQG
jgi:RNA polymerase sigma-70 factor, ECF subfamily